MKINVRYIDSKEKWKVKMWTWTWCLTCKMEKQVWHIDTSREDGSLKSNTGFFFFKQKTAYEI
ncbi:hypothetical protein MPTA9349_7300 [Mycoplasmoides pneumoniae]